MQTLLRKASTEQIIKDATFEPLSMKQRRFLDTEKVDVNRVRSDRFNKMLEAQYMKKNQSLERNLQNQVLDHQKSTMRNNSTIPKVKNKLDVMPTVSQFKPDD